VNDRGMIKRKVAPTATATGEGG